MFVPHSSLALDCNHSRFLLQTPGNKLGRQALASESWSLTIQRGGGALTRDKGATERRTPKVGNACGITCISIDKAGISLTGVVR